ncbi:MAG: hypothetical protein ACI9BD_000623, partial [Candidatus Marinamargulisbacteria bacterium]
MNVALQRINKLRTTWFPTDFWIARFLFIRGLGGLYFIAFLSLLNQWRGLIGESGILPAVSFIDRITSPSVPLLTAFFKWPTLFLFHISDPFIHFILWVGTLLALAVACGLTNGISLFLLWALYLSVVQVGQLFYGFGWESMMLETGFLAIFIYPFFGLKWFPKQHPPSRIMMLLISWILFRTMFGAGLIKLRGHACWRDLTCLFYHFETQPIPNPLSAFFHFLPKSALKFGVFFNHFVELIVPFFLFAPRTLRAIAGFLIMGFQFSLILSGNLSWLNWLTLLLCIPCFNDNLFRRVFKRLPNFGFESEANLPQIWIQRLFLILILLLSIKPTINLFSKQQFMNASFEPFHIVNTYGAFGHIGTNRKEVIILGTSDPVISRTTKWTEYDFKAKPGNPFRKSPIVSPYHYRLDWQIWFAAMGNYQQHPWVMHLIYHMLQNTPEVMDLLSGNPFRDIPPTYIRADLYDYQFTKPNDPSSSTWDRTYNEIYLPPISLDNSDFRKFLAYYGWGLPAKDASQ